MYSLHLKSVTLAPLAKNRVLGYVQYDLHSYCFNVTMYVNQNYIRIYNCLDNGFEIVFFEYRHFI